MLVSASGAPGTAALLRALRENGEREVRLVGTDMSERSIGRHLCDAFHLVPAGSDPEFPDAMLDVVAREDVDAVLPQSSFDLQGLADQRDRFDGAGARLAAGRDPALERQGGVVRVAAPAGRAGARVPPRQRRARGRRRPHASSATPTARLLQAGLLIGLARASACSTPRSTGRTSSCTSGPASVAMRLEEAVELLPGEGGPDLLVMELATGGERTIDGIADGKRVVLGHPKTREAMRAGLAMYFVTLDDPALMEIADRIVAELAIEHFFNIQLVGEQVIEINPRISTIVYQEDLNLPYLGVKRALGEISDEELDAARARVRPGADGAALLRPGRVGRLTWQPRGWDVCGGSASVTTHHGRLLDRGESCCLHRMCAWRGRIRGEGVPAEPPASRRPLPGQHCGRAVDERPGAPPSRGRRASRRLRALHAPP